MTQNFDPRLEQELSTWLSTHVGLEFFKGGFERLGDHFQVFKNHFNSRNVQIITIAGTNGKGQTSLLLERELKSAGKKVGLWTSPHILSVTERFRFDGLEIGQVELLNQFKLLGEKPGKTELSYYEFLFHIFLSWIHQKDIDVLILEVGLGGRLDAVNFFDADIAAIVSIGRDHQEILGNSLKNILKEKMGITRAGIPLVTSIEQSFLRAEIEKFNDNKSIPWLDLYQLGWNDDETTYEVSNARLAKVLAYTFLKSKFPLETPAVVLTSLPELKGRCEKMTLDNVRFIFIGAHNVDGMRKLTQSVSKQQTQYGLTSNSILWLSFSSRSNEEVETIFDIWEASGCLYREIWISPFDHPKAFDKDKLIKLVEKRNKGNIHLVLDWKERIKNLRESESILVSGSYYFIGSMQSELLSRGGKGSLSVQSW